MAAAILRIKSILLAIVDRFPGHSFAFTVFDDTDFSTVENTRPVYDFLAELGFRTTKSVWPLPNAPGGSIGGSTLQDPGYAKFIVRLQELGFEIGLHNVRNHDATRTEIVDGMTRFKDLLGDYPRSHTNHARNRDNIYWGPNRLCTSRFRHGYIIPQRLLGRDGFDGHVRQSNYFWADICQAYISYVRNFVFKEINLDRINPTLPYHHSAYPLVNYWFSSSDGADVATFCKTIAEREQDRLEQEGGVCIMYTHFSQGFCEGNRLNSRFVFLMKRLAAKNGWFVPVSTLLDHLRNQGERTIPRAELENMERRWIFERLYWGTA
jgi:hypothetical protein